MNCQIFKKRLEDYLENGLDFAGRFALERHAGQCVHCGRRLADARKLGFMARELSRVKAPPGFESNVMNEIAARKLRRGSAGFGLLPGFGFGSPAWRKLVLTASCLIVLGFGFLYIYGPLGMRSPRGGALEADLRAIPADVKTAVGNRPDPSGAISPGYRVSIPEILGSEGEDGLSVRFQANESDYGEYTALGPDNVPMIIPLPNTIRMQVGPPSEQFFLTNVSH
jgi:hypothetical protein